MKEEGVTTQVLLFVLPGNEEFNGNINSGESDIFLVKYNSDGVKQ